MLKLQNQNVFSKEIEKLVREKKMPYLDAILEYIKDHNIDVEQVPKLINKTIKDRLETEATELNLLGKKPKKLTFVKE